MPESVKISQLPVASSVQGTDLIPVVKMVGATPAETNRATAAQIAAVGGGPPGANSVTDASIANGALSASKSGYSASQRIAVSKTQTTIGGSTRFICQEIECSQWAESLLASDNAAEGWGVLSANPTFSGPINVPRGSPTAPSYGFTGQRRQAFICQPTTTSASLFRGRRSSRSDPTGRSTRFRRGQTQQPRTACCNPPFQCGPMRCLRPAPTLSRSCLGRPRKLASPWGLTSTQAAAATGTRL